MANKNFQNYAVAGNNVALTYDNVGDTVTIDVNVDKTDVGLGNVDNTSDINKPISTLVQNALNLKEGTITAGTTAQYYRGDKTFQTLDKTAVGLSNVDNTTDLLKPISTATQTALNGKQALATNLTSISALTFASTSFVKMTAAGTFALDTNTYLTAESDTLTSVTGRGNVTTNFITIGGVTANQSVTASGGIARANYLNNTLVASANNDTLIGLDINPTFTTGAFTNVRKVSLRYPNQSWIQSANVSGVYYNILGIDLNNFVISGNSSLNSAFFGSELSFTGTSVVRFVNNAGTNFFYCYTGTTGNIVIQNGGTFTDSGFRLDVNGTARIQNQLTTTGSITAASAIARGVYMNQTLVASANNDVLVGLDISPTFTNGAFTGVNNLALRVNGKIYSQGALDIGRSNVSGVLYSDSSETTLQNTTSTARIAFRIGVDMGRFMPTTGNLILQNGGTFTDAGFRLDVVGADSRFNGIRAGLGAGQVATNTVFGNGALNANTSATSNTAIGYEAIKSTTTGTDNTALGYFALRGNITGGYNVAIGTNALALGTAVTDTIAIGGYAGNNITSGNFNTAIGANALRLCTTASNNTAIGSDALRLTTGFSNTGIGGNALNANTTGFNNTAIGYNNQSGNFSGCLILGVSATATANNQFVVGSSTVNAGAVVTETNTSSQVWNVIINGVARKILLA
jgi:hypothetical protein